MTSPPEAGAMRRLGRESAAYAVGGALSRVVNLLLLPAYTAAIPPREYGALAALLLLAALVTPLATLGLGASTGIAYFDRSGDTARARVVWTAAAVTLVTAAALVVIALTASERLSDALFESPEYRYPATLALLSAAASAVSQPLMLGVQFRRQVSRYVWISAATATFGGALGLVLVALAGRGVQGVLEAQLASQLLLLGVGAREAWIAGRPGFDMRTARDLLRLGLPLVPSFLFLLVLQQGNQFLLKELRGLRELGVYIVGHNLGLVMSLVVSGFTTAWMPFFLSFSRDPASGLSHLSRAMTYYVIGAGSLTLLFFVWARPAVGLLAADSYQDAYVAVGYSAAAYFLVGVFSVLLPPLYYAKQVWAVTLIQGVGVLVAVSLQAKLIGQLGVLGAGIGLAAGFLVLCLLLYAWLNLFQARYVRIPYDWRRILAFSSLITLGAIAFSLPVDVSALAAIAWSLGASAIVLVCTWMALNADERRALTVGIRNALCGQAKDPARL